MSFEFTGAWGVPGIASALETVEKQIWWNRWEDQVWIPAVLGGAARDSGNTGYTDVLRPGLILGRKTSDKKFYQWDPAQTDGTQIVAAVLGHSMKMTRLGSNQDRFIGWAMVAGRLKMDSLLVYGQTSYGLAGLSTEYQVRAHMHGKFTLLADEPGAALVNRFGGWVDVQAKATSYTVTEGDNNVLFTTRGAGGAVTFTLPATPKLGLHYGFYNVEDQNMIVTTPGANDTMVAINDKAADSVAFQTSSLKIGGMFEIFGDGTGWLARVSAGQTSDGTTSGQLVTVAT